MSDLELLVVFMMAWGAVGVLTYPIYSRPLRSLGRHEPLSRNLLLYALLGPIMLMYVIAGYVFVLLPMFVVSSLALMIIKQYEKWRYRG